MAKEYYKKSTGLAPTNTPKIRIYDTVDDAVNDLDNLNVGDVIASKLVEGAADIAEAQQIIADSVAEISSVIPDDAGVTNQLVTQDDLEEVTDKMDSTASSTNKLLSQDSIEALMNTFADTIEPIGTIKLAAVSSGWDSHWHECDGTNGTLDLRECVPVGVGTNATDTITEHDVYTLGQFKDDQIKDHYHSIQTRGTSDYYTINPSNPNPSTSGVAGWGNPWGTQFNTATTTHGKQKGVVFIQKISNYAS